MLNLIYDITSPDNNIDGYIGSNDSELLIILIMLLIIVVLFVIVVILLDKNNDLKQKIIKLENSSDTSEE